MKFHYGEKVLLNSMSKDLSIHDKAVFVDNMKSNCTIKPLTAAQAFVSDISLRFTTEDFRSIPELIGSGFFAKVYLVYNISKEINMAFKVPKPTESINKFFKEIKLLKHLDHENILRFYGTCLNNGDFGYLSEYLDSGNLSSLIERKGQDLAWSTRVYIAENIANGLVYLHSQFIIHRDLSAENILLSELPVEDNSEPIVHYRAVIADFGLFLNMKHSRSDRMSTVGNPFYTAPEHLKNESPYNYSSDVFSFGMILCELITGLKNDPNQIPRTNNYGLDYKKLPIKRDCPKWIQGLACDCCMVHVLYRPTMSRAYETIAENKQYIGLWYRQRPIKKSVSDISDLPYKSFQVRNMSISVSPQYYLLRDRFSPPVDMTQNRQIFNHQTSLDLLPKAFRKFRRNNSVDSFLDPRLINFDKACKDPGYVDKPLTESMRNLDPRLCRCTSESECIYRSKSRNTTVI